MTNSTKRFPLGNVIIALLVEKFPGLYGTGSSLPCSQEPLDLIQTKSDPLHILHPIILAEFLIFKNKIILMDHLAACVCWREPATIHCSVLENRKLVLPRTSC
jgi:hypothetical protein